MIEYANNITTGKKWKWPAMSIDSTKPIIERERKRLTNTQAESMVMWRHVLLEHIGLCMAIGN